MKYAFLLLIVFNINIALAQKGILAGKVVDENGHPMAKVKVELVQGDKTVVQKTNRNGLYYIDALTKGSHTITIIPARKKKYIAKNIIVEPQGINHTYYTFVLSGSQVQVIANKHDPFTADIISELKSYKNIEDIPNGKIIVIDPKTGETESRLGMPKDK